MPYFHATFKEHIPSILKHGLGGKIIKQNWEGCDPGVYLSSEPGACIFVMADQYAQFGDPDSVPREHFANIVLIVIDDTRIQPVKLKSDPLIDRKDVWLYKGVVDVTNMPIIPFSILEAEYCSPNDKD